MASNLHQILACPVCQRRIFQPVRVKECMHAVCKKCIKRIVHESGKGACPVCNESINIYNPWKDLIKDSCLQSILDLLDRNPYMVGCVDKVNDVSNKQQSQENMPQEEKNTTMICVKVWRRRFKMSPQLYSRFPSECYFQVPDTAPVSVLAHIVRKIIGKGNDCEMTASTRKRIRGVGRPISLEMTFADVAKKARWDASRPLELYIEPLNFDYSEDILPSERPTYTLQTNETCTDKSSN